MDSILELADDHVFDHVYPVTWERGNIWRQFLSILGILNVGSYPLYFITAGLSYLFIYDRRIMQHPLFLQNQLRREILYTCWSIPYMSLPTGLLFLLEVRGYSKLFSDVSARSLGWLEVAVSVVLFLLFTDMCIYWIHRWLHHPLIYKYIHKFHAEMSVPKLLATTVGNVTSKFFIYLHRRTLHAVGDVFIWDHHIWKVTTPFASHAFHPADGFLQSCPYHLYVFLFPMYKWAYMLMFLLVNVWTVSIHDGDFRVPAPLKPLVNGSAHHTDHHLYYNFNYGQFTTLWDRLGGSFRKPSAWDGQSPLDDVLRLKREKHCHGNEHVTSAAGGGPPESGDHKTD